MKTAETELALHKNNNQELQKQIENVRAELEQSVFNLTYTCELLEGELKLRDSSHLEMKDNVVRENKVLSIKLDKLKSIITCLLHQNSEFEMEFFEHLENHMWSCCKKTELTLADFESLSDDQIAEFFGSFLEKVFGGIVERQQELIE